jgi:hypothetical protein
MFSDFSKVTPSIIASQIVVRVWSKVKSLSDLNICLMIWKQYSRVKLRMVYGG